MPIKFANIASLLVPTKVKTGRLVVERIESDDEKSDSVDSVRSKADRKKLDGLISGYKPTKGKKKKNIFDDYLLILMNLPNTKRYAEFFDPLRLRMFLIKPSDGILRS